MKSILTYFKFAKIALVCFALASPSTSCQFLLKTFVQPISVVIKTQPAVSNTNPNNTGKSGQNTTQVNTASTSKTIETAAAYSVGIASYYSNSLHGRKTASGEVYDKDKLTAAHKTLPFQTKVEVRNTKNSRTVVVVINDRLPQTNKREIDLSEEAAKSLDMMKDGIVEVELRLLK